VQSKYSRMKFEESMQKVLEYIEGSSSGWVPAK
jgi:hypothetical protein